MLTLFDLPIPLLDSILRALTSKEIRNFLIAIPQFQSSKLLASVKEFIDEREGYVATVRKIRLPFRCQRLILYKYYIVVIYSSSISYYTKEGEAAVIDFPRNHHVVSAVVYKDYLVTCSYIDTYDPRKRRPPMIITYWDDEGKEVKTIVDQQMSPGNYETDFNGNGLASGLYFYRLEANGFSETRKMILLK